MTKQFKKMKFWFEAGEVELYDAVCKLLESQGYSIDRNIRPNKPNKRQRGVKVTSDGLVSAACSEKNYYWDTKLADYEEINIDWLRTTPPETVELGGKTYLKSELEVALENINPIGE